MILFWFTRCSLARCSRFTRNKNNNTSDICLNKIYNFFQLYFKGPFTALLVNYEREEWQFIIKPPSPLPDWFYTEHSNLILDKNGMYIYIPSAVREKFLAKLINLLTKLFGFPIN